ncbi:hypothetical protein EDB83DRAFT_2538536 [Lactarius deliciosus]|nr:hypothetical protein EDB83DRAFT_2538536 [Lactarius deliciosus]
MRHASNQTPSTVRLTVAASQVLLWLTNRCAVSNFGVRALALPTPDIGLSGPSAAGFKLASLKGSNHRQITGAFGGSSAELYRHSASVVETRGPALPPEITQTAIEPPNDYQTTTQSPVSIDPEPRGTPASVRDFTDPRAEASASHSATLVPSSVPPFASIVSLSCGILPPVGDLRIIAVVPNSSSISPRVSNTPNALHTATRLAYVSAKIPATSSNEPEPNDHAAVALPPKASRRGAQSVYNDANHFSDDPYETDDIVKQRNMPLAWECAAPAVDSPREDLPPSTSPLASPEPSRSLSLTVHAFLLTTTESPSPAAPSDQATAMPTLMQECVASSVPASHDAPLLPITPPATAEPIPTPPLPAQACPPALQFMRADALAIAPTFAPQAAPVHCASRIVPPAPTPANVFPPVPEPVRPVQPDASDAMLDALAEAIATIKSGLGAILADQSRTETRRDPRNSDATEDSQDLAPSVEARAAAAPSEVVTPSAHNTVLNFPSISRNRSREWPQHGHQQVSHTIISRPRWSQCVPKSAPMAANVPERRSPTLRGFSSVVAGHALQRVRAVPSLRGFSSVAAGHALRCVRAVPSLRDLARVLALWRRDTHNGVFAPFLACGTLKTL